MNEILDTDEGARYIGEFAIGVNPYILHPMKDTLFDEKSTVPFISRRDKPMKSPTTATVLPFTGISCLSSVPNTAAAKSGSTTCLSAKTDVSLLPSWNA